VLTKYKYKAIHSEMQVANTPMRMQPYRGSMGDGSMGHSALEWADRMLEVVSDWVSAASNRVEGKTRDYMSQSQKHP
jgi:hypothetical protein